MKICPENHFYFFGNNAIVTPTATIPGTRATDTVCPNKTKNKDTTNPTNALTETLKTLFILYSSFN